MATASEFKFVQADVDDGVARFTDIVDYDGYFKLTLGKSLVDDFPDDATIKMRTDFPDDIEVVDSLKCARSFLVLSEKARAAFEAAGVDQVEYFPVKVLNHKGRAAPGEFFAVNVLATVDCIDKDASDLVWNDIDPTVIDEVNALALSDAPLANAPKFFRPVHMPYAMLLHQSVIDELEANGLRGFSFTPVEEFFP